MFVQALLGHLLGRGRRWTNLENKVSLMISGYLNFYRYFLSRLVFGYDHVFGVLSVRVLVSSRTIVRITANSTVSSISGVPLPLQ